MSEDLDKTIINPEGAEPEATDKAASEKGSKGFLGNKKLLIFGGGGLVVIILAVVGVMLLMGGDNKSAAIEEQPAAVETASASKADQEKQGAKGKAHAESDQSEVPDVADPAVAADEAQFGDASDFELTEEELAQLGLDVGGDDASALGEIEASLDFLDFDPTEEMQNPSKKEALAKEDSIEEANWLDEENAKLAALEQAVTQRERAVAALEKEVSKKMLVIEQAESARIAQLAKLYDGMDPRSVTQLMVNLDDNIVVSIISRMKQNNAAQVMSLIAPKRAARLSKMMITIAEN